MIHGHMTTTTEGRGTIILYGDGMTPTTINESHPNYLRIATAILRQDDIDTDWLSAGVRRVVEVLSDRVEVIDGVLHFDGDAVYDALGDTISRYHAEGRDTAGIVRFMERLADNPNAHSREQLFTWSMARDLTITEDGYLVAYKGVSEDLLSISAGKADVNGVTHTGNIPNPIGAVVSMPRAEVEFNPGVGCSKGLHVGNRSYAGSFGPVTLEVLVDPADVVSVPTDCSWQKMRVCRYQVVALHENDYDDLSDYEPDAEWDQDDAWDDFVAADVPEGFWSALKSRLRRRER